jgi:hypothetical protein
VVFNPQNEAGRRGETVGGCGAKLGAAAPWRARPGGAGRLQKPVAGVLPCFGAEGGRRARWAEWVKG